MRRLALALCVALGGVAVTATASEAQTLVQATVYEPDGTTTPDQVTLADLVGAGSACPEYHGSDFAEYDQSGQVDTVQKPLADSGSRMWPVSSILACLEQTHLSPSDVQGGVIVHDTSGRAQLGRYSQLGAADLDVADGTDFPDSTTTPVIFSHGSTWDYHRPRRATDDANYDDAVSPDSSTPIAIDVYTVQLLHVQVTASPGTVDAGDPVQFTATVQGGSGLSYRWTFGDGESSTEQAPAHRYAQGTYTARLQVTGAGGSGGGDQATVTVNGPAEPQTTPGPSSPGPTDGGTGPAPPGKGSKDKSPGKKGGSAENRSTGSGSKRGTTKPRRQRSPQATATPSAPSTATGSGSGSGGSSSGSAGATRSTQSGAGRRKPANPNRTRPPKTPETGLERVSGRLVGDVIPLSAAASPLVTETGAPRGSAPAERRHVGGSSWPAIVAGALAVLALLALGAARELDVRWRALLPRIGG